MTLLMCLIFVINNVNVKSENRYITQIENCKMRVNLASHNGIGNLCSFSYSGFEVSYYPVDSLKMFYLDYTNCDSYVNKTIFRERPFFKLRFLYPDDLFTLMMLDSTYYFEDLGKANKFFLHYFVCNVLGEDLGFADIGDALELADYIPPVPMKTSKNHTILFLLYQQTNELQLQYLNLTLLTRKGFDPVAWANQQRHLKFCGPVAALQMKTSY